MQIYDLKDYPTLTASTIIALL